jgi:hypothetical protein
MNDLDASIFGEIGDDVFDDEYFDDEALFDEALEELGEEVDDLSEGLRGALAEEFADCSPEELDAVLDEMLESVSPAEAVHLGSALQQIGQRASTLADDQRTRSFAASALPVAGGAVGTLVGGPAGTAVGSALGSAAAKALGPRPTAGARSSTGSAARSATGSAAAARALMMTQNPQVLRSLLAVALGAQGRRTIDGVPVGAVMGILTHLLGQAAADADELLDADDELPTEDWTGRPWTDPADPGERADWLYAELVGDDTDLLTEAVA